jgi:hypothetical protein
LCDQGTGAVSELANVRPGTDVVDTPVVGVGRPAIETVATRSCALTAPDERFVAVLQQPGRKCLTGDAAAAGVHPPSKDSAWALT